jgi:tripartite-type tricarboxylate transporter receptor subunit TctC
MTLLDSLSRAAWIPRLIVLGLALTTTMAAAQSFPSRPIKIIVPYSTGSGSDTLARTIGQAVAERAGQPVVVENHEGGGSLVGTLIAARAPADGYTILIVANPFVIAPAQRAASQYDPLRDFIPIAKVAIVPLVLVSSTSVPVKNMAELVAYAKANPGKLTYASSGPGTISQQEMEVFKAAAGLNIVELGYKSTGQALTDVIGGHMQLFPVVVSSVLPHLNSDRIRILGIFDTQRSPLLPNVPSTAEGLGVPDYVPTPVWYGFVAPAGTPDTAVNTLNRLFRDAMQAPEVRDRLNNIGAQPVGPTNAEFAAEMKTEMEKAVRLSKRLGTGKQ